VGGCVAALPLAPRLRIEPRLALLNEWRREGRIFGDVYHHLEELDRAELDVATPGSSWLDG
jgi:hypothetical protein